MERERNTKLKKLLKGINALTYYDLLVKPRMEHDDLTHLCFYNYNDKEFLGKIYIKKLDLDEKTAKEKTLTQILSEIDWRKILWKAIELRPTSWADHPFTELRNAGDTIYSALMIELREKGYVP